MKSDAENQERQPGLNPPQPIDDNIDNRAKSDMILSGRSHMSSRRRMRTILQRSKRFGGFFPRCGKRDIVFAGFFLFAVIVGGSV